MSVLIFPHSSNPSISSIITSLIIRSMLFFPRICKASSPLDAEMTKYSSDNILERKSRISGLSSGSTVSGSPSSVLISVIIVSSTRFIGGAILTAACLGKCTEMAAPLLPSFLSLASILPFISWMRERVICSPMPIPSLFSSLLFLTW